MTRMEMKYFIVIAELLAALFVISFLMGIEKRNNN